MESVTIRPADQPGDLGWIVQAHGELYSREFGWSTAFEEMVAKIVGAVRRRPRSRSRAGLDRRGRRPAGRLHRLHARRGTVDRTAPGAARRSEAARARARRRPRRDLRRFRASGRLHAHDVVDHGQPALGSTALRSGWVRARRREPAHGLRRTTWSARTGSYRWPTRVRLPPFGGSLVGQNLTVIVLAAGGGTRMKSKTMKVLHQVGGRSMIGHVLNAVQAVEPQRVVAVVGHQREEVGAHIHGPGARVRAGGPGGAARHRRRRTRRDRGGRRASAAPSSSPPATPRCCAATACARSRRSTRRRSAR